MALDLPAKLTQRYRGDDYIARMPFIINSRLDTQDAADRLSHRQVGARDLFIGIPGFRSLDMLSTIGSHMGKGYRQAVLFDVNAAQVKAMNAVLHMIRHAETPEAFAAEFSSRYMSWIGRVPRKGGERQTGEDKAYFAVLGRSAQPRDRDELERHLDDETMNPYSWLFPSNYARIRSLVENGDIATAVMDLKDGERVAALRGWMMNNGLRTGDVYLSSSILFMSPDRHFSYYSREKNGDTGNYLRSLLSLSDDHTRILFSQPTPMQEHHEQERNEFQLAVGAREAFERLFIEWQALPEVPLLERRYQYLFQVGDAAYQIGSFDEDRPSRPGRVRLDIAPEIGDFKCMQAAALRRELKTAGLEVDGPRSAYDAGVRLFAGEAELSRRDFFPSVAHIAGKALSPGLCR